MKTKVMVLVFMVFFTLFRAQGQGTAFTYQGRLESGDGPVTGDYDLIFSLYPNAAGSNLIGDTFTSDVLVSNGLFTATVDFGFGVFTGAAYWLAVDVRTNNGGAYTRLSPLQALTPAPYAIFAASASNVTGSVSYANLGTYNFIQNGVTSGTVSGGEDNQLFSGDDYATIAGGLYNSIQTGSFSSFIGGGQYNGIGGNDAGCVLAGGVQNNIATNSGDSVIGGGAFNYIQPDAYSSVIAGGQNNSIGGFGYGYITGNVIGGGLGNQVFAGIPGATIAGGFNNTNGGYFSTIPGGRGNLALGSASFAAGLGGHALHPGAFVWADDSEDNGAGEPTDFFSSTRNNQFRVRAAGGVDFEVSGSFGLNPAAVFVNSTASAGVALWASQNSSDSTTVFVNSGTGDIIKGFSGGTGGNLVFEVKNDGTVNSQGIALTSDKNAKENFAPISATAILDKVTALPISEWNYKTDQSARHIGPTAQDFHAAFGLSGDDDRHISVIDGQGVALAAIQGLNQELRNQESQISARDNEILQLQQSVAELKQIVRQLSRQNKSQ